MTIYLVACGSRKVNHPIKARQMYIGAYFKTCLKYAESQLNDGIYILSAMYGIVKLEEIIEPYDMIITDDNAVSVTYVKDQVINKGLLQEKVIMLGGKKYVNFVKKIWKDNVTCPLTGGMLSQMSQMNKQIKIEEMKKQMEMWK